MEAEPGTDFDCIEVGQPAGQLGLWCLSLQAVDDRQQQADHGECPVVHACKKSD